MNAYSIAKSKLGLREIAGEVHNDEIVAMFATVGHSWVKDDETAWCAAFVGWALELSGGKSTRKLNARSYLAWGEPVDIDDAREGDIVVFSRGDPKGWQGHVAFFVRREGGSVYVLGGNQGNAVSIRPYTETKLLGVRRSKVATPEPTGFWAALLKALGVK